MIAMKVILNILGAIVIAYLLVIGIWLIIDAVS